MKIPALDSLRLLCLLALLVPFTAWSQGSPPPETDASATVELLATVPEKGAETKDLGETLKLNASGPTFVWAKVTLNGVKNAQGLRFFVEWQIKDGSDWRPLRADHPRKPLDISLSSPNSPVFQKTNLQRLVSQELKPSDKGTLRVRVLYGDDKELAQDEVTLAK
ncbi:MAG: hypothetical protein QOF80_1013 [Verrucomicrobiota bacterium]|jgi:hypothetical protein